jgi:hypothetical protein
MNLRCIYCQTPFTLSRTEMLSAIVSMNEKGQNHYDAHCPRCRRANSISRQRMELFFPNWQEAAKQQAAAPAEPPPLVPASASLRTEPVSKAMKAAVAKQAAAESAKAKKPAATATSSAKEKKTVAKKKAGASKPAAKKTPAKGKKK